MRLLSILFLLFGATGASHERISEIAIRDNESEDENAIWSAKGVTHADLREEAASDLNLPEDYEEKCRSLRGWLPDIYWAFRRS